MGRWQSKSRINAKNVHEAGLNTFLGADWNTNDKYAGAVGGGLLLGAGYQFSPNFSMDLQLTGEGYMGVQNYSNFYFLLSPRLGINIEM